MMKAQSGYSGRSPKRKGYLLAAAIIITLPLALWATRTGWLPLIYKRFVVAEAPQKADFIVILGGGEGMRARTAAASIKRVTPLVSSSAGASIPINSIPC